MGHRRLLAIPLALAVLFLFLAPAECQLDPNFSILVESPCNTTDARVFSYMYSLCISDSECAFRFYQSEYTNRRRFDYLLTVFFSRHRKVFNVITAGSNENNSNSPPIVCIPEIRDETVLAIMNTAVFCSDAQEFILGIGCVCRNGKQCQELQPSQFLDPNMTVFLTTVFFVGVIFLYLTRRDVIAFIDESKKEKARNEAVLSKDQ